jgi:uncharacterized protein (TIGR04222 family)
MDATTGAILTGVTCCVIAAMLWWRRRNYTRGAEAGDLSPLHVALLAGGSDRAVAASLAGLRVAGAVRVVDGSLRRDAPPHADASELDLAVYAAAGAGLAPRRIAADPHVRKLLAGAGRALVDGQLLLTVRERRLVREATIPVFALALTELGLALPYDGDPLPLLPGATAALAGLLFLRVDRLPSRSRALLARARREAAFLAPGAAPDLMAHGPQVAGLAVALFGGDVLRDLDPDLSALCTGERGEQVEPDRAAEPRYRDLPSAYLGGPTGPVGWNDTGGDRAGGGTSGGDGSGS